MAAKQTRSKEKSKGSWYVALLRGINVGTAKRISMADLRSLVEGLGYEQVRTLLNSGNVVFTANVASPDAAAAQIEKAIAKKAGFSSRVTVISGADIATIIKENPLLDIADNPSRLLISILTNPTDISKLKPLTKQDWGKESLALGKRAAYQWCPDGILDSELAKSVGRTLGDAVTGRNWATITKLQAMIDESK